MDYELRNALLRCETDVDAALTRLSGDEALYIKCLSMFLEDKTVAELGVSLQEREWDDAFTAAHALKGLAGNMGFIPLFHASAEMVVLIRAGRVQAIGASLSEIERWHDEICASIRQAGIQPDAWRKKETV